MKVTRDELFYIRLMEECAEVQQRISKLLQFGLEQSQTQEPYFLPGSYIAPNAKNNRERLQDEICDALALIELLGYRRPTPEEVKAKEEKVLKYLKYSQDLGTVEVA